MIGSRHRDEHGLTPRQAMAAEHYVLHGSMSAAYRHAYSTSNMQPATVNRKAIDLFRVPAVARRVEQLRAEAEERATITRDEALALLAVIARGKQSAVAVRAIDRLAKMCGWDKQAVLGDDRVTITLNLGDPAE